MKQYKIMNIIIILLSIIAIIAICSFFQISVLGKEYADIFGYTVFKTETGSMSPTIEINDIVFVKLGNHDLNENDIITYKNGKAIITHRIVKMENDTIIAKGDNNNSEDAPITKDSVIGKVVFCINHVAVWKQVFSDIQVIIPVCITLILFVIIVLYKEKTGDENVG